MKNEVNIHQTRSPQEWEELVERYFDAMTSDKEEQELKAFLLTKEATGNVFDEARAVMGFLKVGQTLHKEKSRKRPWNNTHYWKIAAVCCGIAFGAALWNTWYSTNNICEAYIYGEKHTKVAMVMAQVNNSLDKIYDTSEENIIETQLKELFQLMEEE
ncbi:MAG: hypothetical protein IKY99_03770 [Bacteroidaceae bacterium]|nr:hypothetical protein [Bacteroidaceae bacterium]